MFRASTRPLLVPFFFFFNDTATTEIYTLSLHDALPISTLLPRGRDDHAAQVHPRFVSIPARAQTLDRKSTRLNSSHGYISYAVFCLKKKKRHHTSVPVPCRVTPPTPVALNAVSVGLRSL